MKYFKLIYGFDAENYIEIDETELEKAYYCFLLKKDAVYSSGAIRGARIEKIQPDYHRIMGWNRGYKLETLDYEELAQKGIDRTCQNMLLKTKEKVNYLIETKQEHLIGKNVEIPELDKAPEIPVKQRIGTGIKSIGQILS